MATASMMAIVVALGACVTDLRSRRIPNVLTFGAALAAVIMHGTIDGLHGVLIATAGWLIGAAIFFVPFALGGMGGGDVKLLAALGAFLGPGSAVWVALYAGVAGGLIALVVALWRGYFRRAVSNVIMLLHHWHTFGLTQVREVSLEGGAGPRLAYAIPIFVGLMLTLWLH